jgi:hypothetical protein
MVSAYLGFEVATKIAFNTQHAKKKTNSVSWTLPPDLKAVEATCSEGTVC